jgi:hypothetical protein
MLFGSQPYDQPKEFVTSFAREVAQGNTTERPDYTKSIKAALRTAGERLAFYVAPSPGVQKEFLFDVVWFKSSELNDVVMAAESELGLSEKLIWEDFQKLLHVKAPLKILVFRGAESDWAPKVLKGIRQHYLEKFSQHVQGERYIAIEFLFDKKEAHWWQLDILTDGPIGGEFEYKGRVNFVGP